MCRLQIRSPVTRAGIVLHIGFATYFIQQKHKSHVGVAIYHDDMSDLSEYLCVCICVSVVRCGITEFKSTSLFHQCICSICKSTIDQTISKCTQKIIE